MQNQVFSILLQACSKTTQLIVTDEEQAFVSTLKTIDLCTEFMYIYNVKTQS